MLLSRLRFINLSLQNVAEKAEAQLNAKIDQVNEKNQNAMQSLRADQNFLVASGTRPIGYTENLQELQIRPHKLKMRQQRHREQDHQ
eukprot:gene5175-5250_t